MSQGGFEDNMSNMTGGNIEDLDSLTGDDPALASNMRFMYQTKNVQKQAIQTRDGTIFVQDLIKKVIQNSINVITNNEMNLKIPYKGINHMLLQCEKIILPTAGVYDDSQTDYITNGLLEDQEPSIPIKDAWIRSRVIMDKKNIELYDAIGQLPGPQYKKRSPDTRSVYSSKSKASSKYKQTKQNEVKHNPMPIDLSEPLFISQEEEKLRVQKETEIQKKRFQLEQETHRRKVEQNEEQQKELKLKKEKNVIGTTYDYTGELLPVQRFKVSRLPPSTYNMHYEFKNPESDLNLGKKKKQARKQPQIRIKKKENPLPPAIKAIETQPPLLDNIPLSAGVSLTFDGRRRTGGRPQTFDSQSLTLSSMKRGQKIRLNKKDYDEIVLGQEKLGSHKISDDTQRMHNTAENPRDMNLFGKTMDSAFFASKLKSKALGRTKSSTQGIQIESLRMFETMNNQINEEDELLMTMISQKEREEKITEQKKKIDYRNRKTPIDNFNQTLTTNKQWGKQHYEQGNTLMNYPFGIHKQSSKEIYQSLGKTQKPRSRMGLKTPETDLFDLRMGSTDGFKRPGTTSDGFNSSQGIRIRVTGGKQQQQLE